MPLLPGTPPGPGGQRLAGPAGPSVMLSCGFPLSCLGHVRNPPAGVPHIGGVPGALKEETMPERPRVTVLGSLNTDISVPVPRLPGSGRFVLTKPHRTA